MARLIEEDVERRKPRWEFNHAEPSASHTRTALFSPDREALACDCGSGLLSGGFEDQAGDFIGMRDQGEVARIHFDGPGVHPLGHEALEVGIYRAVSR